MYVNLAILALIGAAAAPTGAIAGAPSWSICGGKNFNQGQGSDAAMTTCDNPIQTCTRYSDWFWGCKDDPAKQNPPVDESPVGPYQPCGGFKGTGQPEKQCIQGFKCQVLSRWLAKCLPESNPVDNPAGPGEMCGGYNGNGQADRQCVQGYKCEVLGRWYAKCVPEAPQNNGFYENSLFQASHDSYQGFEERNQNSYYQNAQTSTYTYDVSAINVDASEQDGQQQNDPFSFNKLLGAGASNSGTLNAEEASGDDLDNVKSTGLTFAMIVVISVAGVLITATVVTVVLVYRRQQRRKKTETSFHIAHSPASDDGRIQI